MAGKHVNHLANEKSPYLLQHAYNPVDWYPWGEEAFAKAKEEDKPIFLSIGYSTCHWCHVMEQESFEDEEVAAILNESYVAVKVDREERPDVDHIFMTACQAMTGQGGWPLTIIATPENKPFFAGTYFPKQSRWGRPGLMDILTAVRSRWRTSRTQLTESAENLVRALQNQAAPSPGFTQISNDIVDAGFHQLMQMFDKVYGGFGTAPKFPAPHNLMFLLRYWWKTGNEEALRTVEITLDAMRRGGIYDHIGFGFARYSTDREWRIPHFEKMLYDNALLCWTYLEAYQCTQKTEFVRTAEEIIAYILRDMTSPEGGFYSAEDADSEGMEGKFYAWTPAELNKVLGAENGKRFAMLYDISTEGNFENGTSIPNQIGVDLDAWVAQEGREKWEKDLAIWRRNLFDVREKRVHPFKDDKILTGWNGLMAAALAKASQVLHKPQYAEAAERAVRFIWKRMRRPDGRLLARYRDGEAAYPAYADDYAYLLWALMELYSATYSTEWLDWAMQLADDLHSLFWDPENGGLFLTGKDSERLLVRPKETYDGALPSGNSIAAWQLMKLARMTDSKSFTDWTDQMMHSLYSAASRHPAAHTGFLAALISWMEPPRHIVIAGTDQDDTAQKMLAAVAQQFMPDTNTVYVPGNAGMGSVLNWSEEYQPVGGQAAAYICENFSCHRPVRDVGEFIKTLQEHGGPLPSG